MDKRIRKASIVVEFCIRKSNGCYAVLNLIGVGMAAQNKQEIDSLLISRQIRAIVLTVFGYSFIVG